MPRCGQMGAIGSENLFSCKKKVKFRSFQDEASFNAIVNRLTSAANRKLESTQFGAHMSGLIEMNGWVHYRS